MQRVVNRLNRGQFSLIYANGSDINQPVLETEISPLRLLDLAAQIEASEFVIDVQPSVGKQVIALYGRSHGMADQRVYNLSVAAKNRREEATLIGMVLKQSQ